MPQRCGRESPIVLGVDGQFQCALGGWRSIGRLHWLLRTLLLLLVILFIAVSFAIHRYGYGEQVWRWRSQSFLPGWGSTSCRLDGTTSRLSLPSGIVEKTSDLERRPLWGKNRKQEFEGVRKSLLAMAVGVKQKGTVDQIVQRFPLSDFTVMLLHYDGVVDEWNHLPWFNDVMHIVALHQTKWWFAKRFLHPDIVAPYMYIFLWDEDIGVQNFQAGRYVSIVKEEGLEISQPALDRKISEIHHGITVRNPRVRVHRRVYKYRGNGLCWENSTSPPCTGWVEMMVPVFSIEAWRCTWHLIQNDLIHGWGLDMKLGYCVHGDRTAKIGVVDAEYVVHLGVRTLAATDSVGSLDEADNLEGQNDERLEDLGGGRIVDSRVKIRKRSYRESHVFHERWVQAVEKDDCWTDPYV